MPHHFPFLIQPLQITWPSLGPELTESERGEGEGAEAEAKTRGRLDPGEKRREQ